MSILADKTVATQQSSFKCIYIVVHEASSLSSVYVATIHWIWKSASFIHITNFSLDAL